MSDLDFTHDSDATCWVEGAALHPEFPVQNLPLGIFTPPYGGSRRCGIAIGEWILDLPSVALLLKNEARVVAELGNSPTLNPIFDAGPVAMRDLRHGIFRLLTEKHQIPDAQAALYKADECELHLPAQIGDYTDFYTGINHAENIGKLFRPDNPLLPNYKYVPIAYHGRSSSIRISGADVVRPRGQVKALDEAEPQFIPSRRLDYELEMGLWIGRGNDLGEPIPIPESGKHIAGVSILNDWSARDIQAWEYQPLGPFLSKNFLSTISPWVITSDALIPFRTAQPKRPEGDPDPLPHLADHEDQRNGALSVKMEVHILTEQMREGGVAPHCLSRSAMTDMYWTPAQMVTQHSSNGCNMQAGDLLGTGTISGTEDGSQGSLMELSLGGKTPIMLLGGERRNFLENGDEIIITAFAEKQGAARIGFGECRGTVRPAAEV